MIKCITDDEEYQSIVLNKGTLWTALVALKCLLQAFPLLLIAHRQVSGHNLAFKISVSVLLIDGQSLF